MKFDFTKVVLTDIDGKVVEKHEIHKAIANVLWSGAKKLDLVEVAMSINRGEEVELEKVDVAELLRLVKDPKAGFFAYAQKAILDYIESIQNPKPGPVVEPEPQEKEELVANESEKKEE